MLRVLGILAIVAVLGSAMFASAATLDVDGGAIQAGEDMTLYCTNSAVVAGWGLEREGNTIDFVRVRLDPDCYGSYKLFVRLFDKDGEMIGDGSLVSLPEEPGIGYSVTIPQKPSPEAVEGIKIWLHTSS